MSVSWLRVRVSASGMRDWPLLQLRPLLIGYVILAPVAAAVAIGFTAMSTSFSLAVLAKFAALLLCGLASVEATRRMDEPQGALVRDLLTVWCLPIAVLLPPFWALLAPIPLLSYTQWRVHRGVLHRRVFSAAAIGLAYGSASVAFHALPATIAGPGLGGGAHAVRWALAVAACDVLAWSINNGIISVAIKASDPSMSLAGVVFGRESMIADFVQFCLGVVVTIVVAVNPVLLVFAAPSVLLQRRFMMHAQLVSESRIDGKTGLLNAVTWQREARLEITRAIRTRTPLAVAIADIDHFKAVNDTYGHLAGDAVLAGIARAMSALLRDYDIIGRFGGEEFAILLPHTGADEVKRIAERLREKLAEIIVPVNAGTAAESPLQVTISIGVATLDGSRRDLDEMLAAADSALYRAKNTGRNKVWVLAASSAG